MAGYLLSSNLFKMSESNRVPILISIISKDKTQVGRTSTRASKVHVLTICPEVVKICR